MNEQKKHSLFLALTHFGDENETGEDSDNKEVCFDESPSSAAAGQVAQSAYENEKSSVDSEREFEELIKGRYASAFAARTQKIIDKRFKETKILQAKVEENERLISRISELCGGDSPGPHDLYDKLSQMIVKAPEEKSREELENMVKITKEIYPEFDESKELTSKDFKRYVDMGLDFSEAYTLIHLEKIKQDAAREGARQAVRSIGSMGGRPAEGEGDTVTRPVKKGVADLNSSEIKKLIERASKGEKIRFKDI